MNKHTAQANPESIVLIVNDSRGRRGFVLDRDRYTIGRSKRCSIQILDPRVSRCHARLVRVKLDNSNSRFLLLDGDGEKTSSTNGVIVDGKQIKNRMLKVGDKLWLGDRAYIILANQKDLSPEESACINCIEESEDSLQKNYLTEESTEMTKKEECLPAMLNSE